MTVQSDTTDAEAVWRALWEEVVLAHSQWQALKLLFATSETTVQLLNRSAGNFFWTVQQTLYRDVYVGLCRVTDPAQQGRNQNLTLERLLADPRVAHDEAFISDLRAKIEHTSRACEPLRLHRNKLLAHLDLPTRLNRANSLPNPTFGEVEGVLERVADIMNAYDGRIHGSTTFFNDVITRGGPDVLIRRLEAAEKWRAQEREERQRLQQRASDSASGT